MARRKEPTQAEVDALAVTAQDLAIEIAQFAETVQVTQPLETIEAVQKFNQLAEAANRMNRALIALAWLANEKTKTELKLRASA